jgi:hypothetical protein
MRNGVVHFALFTFRAHGAIHGEYSVSAKREQLTTMDSNNYLLHFSPLSCLPLYKRLPTFTPA